MNKRSSERHILSDIDLNNKRGKCSICGPVKLYMPPSARNPRCAISRYIRDNKIRGRISTRSHLCEMCGSDERIAADHDHVTGQFRGWLCYKCNFLLGYGRDRIEIFKAAIAYLGKARPIV